MLACMSRQLSERLRYTYLAYLVYKVRRGNVDYRYWIYARPQGSWCTTVPAISELITITSVFGGRWNFLNYAVEDLDCYIILNLVFGQSSGATFAHPATAAPSLEHAQNSVECTHNPLYCRPYKPVHCWSFAACQLVGHPTYAC